MYQNQGKPSNVLNIGQNNNRRQGPIDPCQLLGFFETWNLECPKWLQKVLRSRENLLFVLNGLIMSQMGQYQWIFRPIITYQFELFEDHWIANIIKSFERIWN